MNKNMKLFNELTARVLDSLFESFPVSKNYEIKAFPEFDNEENSEVFYSTLHFLKNEDYINIQHQVYGGFVDVTLTAKGLSVLNASPVIFETTETISQSIKKALKSGSEDILNDAMKKIFAFGANCIFESMT